MPSFGSIHSDVGGDPTSHSKDRPSRALSGFAPRAGCIHDDHRQRRTPGIRSSRRAGLGARCPTRQCRSALVASAVSARFGARVRGGRVGVLAAVTPVAQCVRSRWQASCGVRMTSSRTWAAACPKSIGHLQFRGGLAPEAIDQCGLRAGHRKTPSPNQIDWPSSTTTTSALVRPWTYEARPLNAA